MTTVARGRQATTMVTVVCRECGQVFRHSEELVQLLRLRGYHPPRRCAACRAYARGVRDAATEALMADHARR